MRDTLKNCTADKGIKWHLKEPDGYYFGDDGLLYKEGEPIPKDMLPNVWKYSK